MVAKLNVLPNTCKSHIILIVRFLLLWSNTMAKDKDREERFISVYRRKVRTGTQDRDLPTVT